MRLRLVAAASLALFALSCSSRYRYQKISPDAAALFARAEAPGPGGSLVLDLEAMRELNFISVSADVRSAEARSALIDVLILTLSTAAAQAEQKPTAELLSRIAVLTAIMRDWGIWPHVQRVGVFVPLPGGLLDPDAVTDHALLVVAAKSDAAANRDLLKGLAAADRATGMAHLSMRDGFLCFENPQVPKPICLRSGSGYIALGTPAALKGIDGARMTGNPASGPLARLRVEIPGMGKGELLMEGHSSLRLAARVQSADPNMSAQLLAAAKEFLRKVDDLHEKSRALLAGSLEQIKQALVADAEAPQGMKAAANRMTVDRLLNPRGEYGQLRDSIKVAIKDGVLSAEVTMPEAEVRRFTERTSMVSAVAITGILAAIAIPQFIRSAGGRDPSTAVERVENRGAASGSSPVVAPGAPGGAPPGDKLEARIASLQQVVAREPKNAEAWIQLGNDYFDTRQPQKAIDAYQRALKIRPNNANVLVDQGVMYSELGQFEKAISNFQRANRVDPKNVKSLYDMGIVYNEDLKQPNKAIEAWEKVIQIAPQSEQAALSRAAIEDAKNAKKAISR